METGANPEQQIREEMLHNIVQQSEGTVGLRMFMDLEADERTRMIDAQSTRSGQPAEALYTTRGGGLNYGEREMPAMVASQYDKIVNNSDHVAPDERAQDTVFFVEGPGETVDVQYRFSSRNSVDDTGRPNNALTMAFSLPKEGALKLREALHADPSFINQVVERQVAALGIDTSSNSKRWMKMNPATLSAVKNSDRQLVIGDGTVEGEQVSVLHSEVVAFGENKSLLGIHTPEASQESPAPQATEAWQPSADYVFDQEAFNATVKATSEFQQKEVTAMKTAGKSSAEITQSLDGKIAELNQWIEEETEDKYIDQYQAEIQAIQEVKKLLQAEQDHKASADTARQNVQEALGAVEKSADQIVIDGQQYTIVDRYNAPNTEKTPWIVIKDANGIEKHVKEGGAK